MFGLSDTHCHLNLKTAFQEDFEEVLSRAWETGLDRILIPGIDLETSRLAVEMAQKDDRIFAAIGIHPNDALKWKDTNRQDLMTLAQNPKVVAIGEIGLDYYREHAPRDIQLEILKIQLELAASLELPVILHNRDAIHDLWPILQDWHSTLVRTGNPLKTRPGVLHAYTGDLPAAITAIDRSFLLGIGGPVTFKNAQDRQEIVRQLPLSSILIETDAPYLAPHPHRGQRNEPGFVSLIADQIALLKQIQTSEVVITTAGNANRLFEWRNRS